MFGVFVGWCVVVGGVVVIFGGCIGCIVIA